MTIKKRALKTEMLTMTYDEMALIMGGKQKPKKPVEKPKTPSELISQPLTEISSENAS